MGRRQRKQDRLSAPVREFRDAEGSTLVLRGALSVGTRREYAAVLHGGLNRDDAAQRAMELLFERLAVSWTVAGLALTRQRELLGRYRMASSAERSFIRSALREHAAEHFPELEVP